MKHVVRKTNIKSLVKLQFCPEEVRETKRTSLDWRQLLQLASWQAAWKCPYGRLILIFQSFIHQIFHPRCPNIYINCKYINVFSMYRPPPTHSDRRENTNFPELLTSSNCVRLLLAYKSQQTL